MIQLGSNLSMGHGQKSIMATRAHSGLKSASVRDSSVTPKRHCSIEMIRYSKDPNPTLEHLKYHCRPADPAPPIKPDWFELFLKVRTLSNVSNQQPLDH